MKRSTVGVAAQLHQHASLYVVSPTSLSSSPAEWRINLEYHGPLLEYWQNIYFDFIEDIFAIGWDQITMEALVLLSTQIETSAPTEYSAWFRFIPLVFEEIIP